MNSCVIKNAGCTDAYTGTNLSVSSLDIQANQNIDVGYQESVCVVCTDNIGGTVEEDNMQFSQNCDNELFQGDDNKEIQGQDTKTVSTPVTVDQCQTLCLAETSFKCRSVEHTAASQQCVLSEADKNKIDETTQFVAADGKSYHQFKRLDYDKKELCTCANEDHLLSSESSKTLKQCTASCRDQPTCAMFLYSSVAFTCKTYSQDCTCSASADTHKFLFKRDCSPGAQMCEISDEGWHYEA